MVHSPNFHTDNKNKEKGQPGEQGKRQYLLAWTDLTLLIYQWVTNQLDRLLFSYCMYISQVLSSS